MTQKIISNLWFDKEAEEAARLYTSLFEHSSIDSIVHYGKAGYEIHGQPAGQVMTVDFRIAGYQLLALNGGPHFQFTPAISLCGNRLLLGRISERRRPRRSDVWLAQRQIWGVVANRPQREE